MRGLKSVASATIFTRGHALVRNIRRGFYGSWRRFPSGWSYPGPGTGWPTLCDLPGDPLADTPTPPPAAITQSPHADAREPGDLTLGNLNYNVDFRSTYASILDLWMQIEAEPIVNGKFEEFAIV
jgi:hypothetical protein